MNKEKQKNLISRPPVVVVLGHIDHGKSSLLEAIRDFKITAKESGGITQHIGAYQVEEQGKKITFIDTPGHEAFSQMRSRGARVADIAILVIDAAEGVKAQTKEAILHIKKSGTTPIVVFNKIDKPEADPEKVKRELSKEDVLVESMGGEIPSIEVSAKTKKGIPELLEVILLVAEMEKSPVDYEKPAEGVIIESYLDNLRGPTATLLVTQGTLKSGDVIGTPSTFTKIKNLEDFQKEPIDAASATDPAVIFGFDTVPKIGEEFKVFPDLESAKLYVKNSEYKKESPSASVLEITEEKKVLNIILKADFVGSVEAVEEILKNFPRDKVIIRIISSGVGNINESDLKLAKERRILILGFRVKIDPIAKKIAEREKVKIMIFEVVYDLVEGIRKYLEKIVEPEELRVDLGKVKALVIFLAEKNRQIVGGKVIEGEIKKGSQIEVFRNEEKIGQGKMINLQRNKKDVDSVSKGEECGILYEGNIKVEEGDILTIYTEEKRKS